MTEDEDPTVSECRRNQTGEQEALKATYGDRVQFVTPAWNVWSPTDCRVVLKPQDSVFLKKDISAGKRDLSAILVVKCSEDYPNRSPQIDLIEPRGLSQEDVRILLSKLRKEAEMNQGFPVIGVLVDAAADFLTDLNPRPAGSFHDNMLANNAKTEAEKNRKRLDTDAKELALLEEEMKQRNAIEVEKALENPSRPESETRIIGGRRIVLLTNAPVERKKPHNTCHEFMGFFENDELLISEWTFRYNTSRSANEAKKRDFKPFLDKLDTVVNELKILCEIKGLDNNLTEYAFVHVEKVHVEANSVLVQLFVAQKIHANEENLETAMEMVSPRLDLVRLLVVQALWALKSLHDSTPPRAHKHLTTGCVWLRNKNSNGFRFSDFGSLGPILSLVAMFGEVCAGRYIPHEVEKEKETDRRKKDLFNLGTILDSLVMAKRTSNYSRVPTPVSGQNSGTNSFTKFISRCQEAKHSDELFNEPFLKEEVMSDSCELFTAFGGSMSKEGRLMSENTVICHLGKGGFGDVLLVRNNMDSSDYAIKRIPLTAASEKYNRKIAKEAKFFAKLNHNNVVRYYNSWEETLVPIVETSSDDDSSLGAVPIPGKEKAKKKRVKSEDKEEVGKGDSLMAEKLQRITRETHSKGAEAKEWSANYFGNLESQKRIRQSKRGCTPSGGLNHLSECSSEEDEEEDTEWFVDYDDDEEEEDEQADEESSSGSDEEVNIQTKRSTATESVFGDEDVVFLDSSKNVSARQEAEQLMALEERSRSKRLEPIVRDRRILCIQMEYCDGGTLRTFIDENKCFNNPEEVWRIFAEILCGLRYMHEMSMIHRDIKPLNIFLSSKSGVKIGDFGLATLEALSAKGRIVQSGGAEKSNSIEAVLSPNGNRSRGGVEVQQTRDIGTQLYMAPELFVGANSKVPYTSKIDVYSAGVVLFEMFYRPLPPSMERVSTLNNLRDDIKIPEDFGSGLPAEMTAVARKTIERMLQKNPDERPSAFDLLNDEDLPMHSKEDATFLELLDKLLKKSDTRMMAYILDKQFDEDIPTAVNYCFDLSVCSDRSKYVNREALVETLRAEFSKVLTVHVFEKFHTHTILPLSTALASASVRTKPCAFLDRYGMPVALPMDLRQNFVRYCVRTSQQRMKRYNFGRVYSQNVQYVHPIEKWECCVDSLGPQASSTSLEAELLLVACEMISKSLPGMKLTLKIGHSRLLEAQMRHLQLPAEVCNELLDALHIISLSDRPHSLKEKEVMLAAHIGPKAAKIITKLMIPVENSFQSFKDRVNGFRSTLKDKEAEKCVDEAIKDLGAIITTFNVCRPEELQQINIVYDSQTCYRPRTFADGLVFQIQVEKANSTNKKGRNVTVLAGGRYDSALLRERHPRDFTYELPLCISGFGINMDLVAQIREGIDKGMAPKPGNIKVLICSLKQSDEHQNLVHEKFRIARKFWEVNVPADVFHTAVDDLESLTDHKAAKAISHTLAVCNPNLEILVTTGTSQFKTNLEDAYANILREMQTLGNQPPQTPIGGPIASTSTPGESTHHDEHGGNSTPIIASRASRSASASHISGIRIATATARASNLNVIFSDDKYHKFFKERKRVESQIRTHLTDFMVQFASKVTIDVLVTDLPSTAIKTLVGELSKTSTEEEIDAACALVSKSGKQDMTGIQKQLRNTLHGPSSGFTRQFVVVLYRPADNFYRQLT